MALTTDDFPNVRFETDKEYRDLKNRTKKFLKENKENCEEVEALFIKKEQINGDDKDT